MNTFISIIYTIWNTPSVFQEKMLVFKQNLDTFFAGSKTLEVEIMKHLEGLRYE